MCDHNKTIEDSGSEVCIECGLVMEPIYHLPVDPIYSQPTDAITFEVEFPAETILRNDLLDVLALIHQDSYFMTERIISFLKAHCSSVPKYSTHSGRCIIAFAIWEVLNRHECPHSPTEIAYLCQISSNDLQQAERKLNLAPTFCPPSFYVHRFASYVGLPKRAAMVISQAVKSVDNHMKHPESLVGAVILATQDQLRVVRGVEFPNNINIESLASTLNVSVYTMKKLRRELPSECLDIISCLVNTMDVSHLPVIQGTLV